MISRHKNVVFTILFSIITGCLCHVALAEPIPIGLLAPLHGGLESYGEDILKGVTLAVNDVNALHKVQFTLKVGDTQSMPQMALSSANALLSLENVRGLIGPMSSTSAIAVAKGLSIPHHIVLISYAAAAPQFGDLNNNNLTFRTIPSDGYRGITLAHLAHNKGFKKLAVLYINNDYGQGIEKSFTSTFEALGGTITKSIAFEPKNDASYASEVLSLSQDKPDALVLFAYPSDGGISIMKDAIQQQAFSFFITDGMRSPQVISSLGGGDLNNRFIGITPHPTESSLQQDFNTHFKQAYGHEPSNPFVKNAYDAAIVMMFAIAHAEIQHPQSPLTPLYQEEIKKGVRFITQTHGFAFSFKNMQQAFDVLKAGKQLSYQGISGDITFDNYGSIPAQNFMSWAYKDGCFKGDHIISAVARPLSNAPQTCF